MTILNRAKFITFEGVEGVGKSTNIQFFEKQLIQSKCPTLLTREPGGTSVGEAIRKVLLDDYDEPILADTEALLFYAARSQHVAYKIKPALENGTWVLCDRFYDASFAYQGAGREMDLARLQKLNEWTLGHFKPDITILLDAPVSIGLERISKRKALDRIENEKAEFFEKVRQCYLDFARQEPERYRVIDASQSIEKVQEQLLHVFEALNHE